MSDYTIDEKFLNDVGITIASPTDRKAKIAQLNDELELRVGQAIVRELTDEEIDEFEEIYERDEDEALIWLKEVYPDYNKVVDTFYKVLRAELKAKRL